MFHELKQSLIHLTSGTFSDVAATACTICPPGFACPNTSDSTARYTCTPGTYSVGGKTQCTPCPAAKFCPHNE